MSKIPEKYRAEARKAMLGAAALGPVTVVSSAADVAAIAGVWAKYLIVVAKGEGISLDFDSATKICTSVFVGAGGYLAGSKVASSVFAKLVAFVTAGLSLVVAAGVSSVANLVFTYYYCVAVSTIFTSSFKDDDISKIITAIGRVFRHFTLSDLGEIRKLLKGK